MAESFNHNVEGEWGWEPLGSEDDGCENSDICTAKSEEYIVQLNDRTESSDKLDKLAAGKRIGKAFSGNNIKGIIASPSFQELEKAIGATIAMSFSGDVVDAESKSLSPGQNISSRNSSSTNLTQQKVIQQRMRQQQFHQKNNSNHHLIKSPLTNSAEVFDATRRELMLFLNEPESRALIILHSSAVSPSDLRSACSKFGVLYYIRPEFHAKGVTFISYFDLHAAMEAKENLTSLFPRDQDVSAHYSIMLHATNSNTEEFKLVVKNLPNDGVDSDVQSIFSRYGSLRCIQKTFGSTDFKSPSQSTSYCVEYFDIQDARLAASELSATSTNVWGPDVIVKFAPLDDSKVHLCRQLLGTLSRWRNEATPSTQSIPPYKQNLYYSNDQKSMPQVAMGTFNAYNAPIDPYAYDNLLKQHAFSTQIHSFNFPYHSFVPNANFIAPFPQQINPAYEPTYIPGPQLSGNHYIKPNGMVPVQFFAANEHEIDRYSQHTNNPSDLNDKRQKHFQKDGSSDFALDLSKICDGAEKRTTIMVKNIPNKYHQQMLLDEVNVQHSGTYDFFYLPIDFKNRCNVGYCFVNFIDVKYIPAFVKDFHGQKWKNFNSEKVCAVSFARIQGKSAMISRFQNSSLLEKEEEYKPLLFISTGPDQGKPEPFPMIPKVKSANSASSDQNSET